MAADVAERGFAAHAGVVVVAVFVLVLPAFLRRSAALLVQAELALAVALEGVADEDVARQHQF